MNKQNLYLFFACTLLITHLSAAAQDQPIELSFTAQPHTYAIDAGPYKVAGYGLVRFGMSVDEVKSLIEKQYSGALAELKSETSLVEKTRVLTIVVPDLAPGPGPATISYVFGASSKLLIAVNVYWLVTGVATDAQQAQLVEAARVLAAGLVGYRWPAFTVARGHVLAPGVLVVFSGKDAAGGGIEVRLNGVPYTLEQRQSGATSMPPPAPPVASRGPAQLRFSMVTNIDKPDIEVLSR